MMASRAMADSRRTSSLDPSASTSERISAA
jgi:hypothetical protein